MLNNLNPVLFFQASRAAKSYPNNLPLHLLLRAVHSGDRNFHTARLSLISLGKFCVYNDSYS